MGATDGTTKGNPSVCRGSEAITERLRVSGKTAEDKLGELLANAASSARQLREEVMKALKQVRDDLRENAKLVAEAQQRGLDTMALRLKEIGDASQTSQDNLRQSVAEGLTTIRQENESKLELMRQIVDEKLQGTLEKRLASRLRLLPNNSSKCMRAYQRSVQAASISLVQLHSPGSVAKAARLVMREAD